MTRATSFAPSACNLPLTRGTPASASGVVQSPGQSSVQLQLHNENPITTDGPRLGNALVVEDISVLESVFTLQCGNGCHQCAVEAGCWSCAGTPSVCTQVCDPDPGGASPDRGKSCAAVEGGW